MTKTKILYPNSSGNNDNNKSSSPKKKGIFQKFRDMTFFMKALVISGILFFLGIFAIFGFYFAVLGGAFGKLPTTADLNLINNSVASEVYSADGVLLGKYFTENRSNVPYKDISPHIVNALVATEDVRFFKHKGVDTRSMFRVLIKSILLNQDAGGGSTISQQLIKNLYSRQNYSLLTMPVNKVKEAIIARRLERVYSKRDILALYLNTVSFGERAYGIGTATERFFSTTPKEIEPHQAATLVGMLKATYSYSPRLFPDKSKTRRNVVIDQMAKADYVKAAEAAEWKKRPLDLKYNNKSQSEGLAPYFRDVLKKELKDWCSKNKKSDGTNYNLYTDGLKIYTTINSKMQAHAEKAVEEHMAALQKDFFTHWSGRKPWGTDNTIIENAKKASDRYKKMKANGKSNLEIDAAFRKPVKMDVFAWNSEQTEERTMSPLDSVIYYQMFLNAGFMAMDPLSSEVLAWVGGITHKHFKYDHVSESKRQVGSTFKPIVYAAALENGAYPCDYYDNDSISYEAYDNWTPKNADGKYGGEYSLQGALANSVNTVSVQLIFEAGIENVVNLAKKMGIVSDLPELPSIALGTAELTLQEMVSAYCVFANGGYESPPFYLKKVTDKNGRKLLENKAPYYRYRGQAMEEKVALQMTKMMEAVVDSGTGKRLRYRYNLTNEIAGKTGTTQNQTDGWFIGFTPELVGGVWVGGENRSVRFRDIGLGQGANMALPIWGIFMDKIYKDIDIYGSKRPGTFKNPTDSDLALMECPFYIPEGYYDNSTTIIYDGGGNMPPQPNINPNNNSNGGTTFIPKENTRGRVKVEPKNRRDQRKEEREKEKEQRKIERKKVEPKNNDKESIWKRLGKGFGIGRE